MDDSVLDRQALVRALRRDAAEIYDIEADVLEVDTVSGAREAIGREDFSCIFLDHDLSDGTSLDLLMEVRAQGLTTPIVVLTGERDERTIVEVMQAGAVDYLPKERLHPDLVARSLRAALLFRQVQREKQQAMDELHTRDRAIAAAPNGIVIADPNQADCPIVYVNEAFLHMTGRSAVEVLGRNCRFLQGEETDPTAILELREAVRQERPCQVSILNYRRDGTTFWNEVTVSPVRDAKGKLTHFVGIQSDVTARHKADAERRQAEEALRRSQEDLRLAIAAARLGTFYCDYPLDKIVWNDTCKQQFFLPPDAEVDFTLFYSLLHPDDREPTRRAIEQAMEGQVAYDVEYRTLASDGRTRWVNAVGRFYYGPDGTPTRFDGITIDISARKGAEEERRQRAQSERFLAGLAERARGLTNPDAVIADAVNSVGQFLGVARCVFADIDIAADTCTVPPDYRADETVASMSGTFPISAFGPFLVGEYEAGRTVVAEDVHLDLVRFPADYVGAYGAVDIRAFVAVPVLHSSRLVSVIAAHSATPRQWKSEEVELLRHVVERTWLTIEVTRQERALVREAEERREASERTARILEGITDAFFTVDHQWRYTYINRQVEALWGRAREELLNMSVWEAWPEAVGTAFDEQFHRAMDEGVAVSFEEFFAPLDAWLEVRVTPSPDGLSVFFQNVSARKSLEEERERLAEREHNIASQLQDALQPALPKHVPRLLVGKFTRPALEEAQIGGDFYDIFALDQDLYAIVIGDVSGKGLAAAQQLALVRNSLRTTLYLYRSPADAVAALNKIMTSHDLLVGFVTAWVGVYDVLTGEITYCSCGHEPGLIRRAGSVVEVTETTGPPLGVAEGAEYSEQTITLSSGEALLLYTDGLSEAGPSRRELLGTDGLTRMLKALPIDLDVQAEAEALVAQVGEFTGRVFRDDVAVLLMRRE